MKGEGERKGTLSSDKLGECTYNSCSRLKMSIQIKEHLYNNKKGETK